MSRVGRAPAGSADQHPARVAGGGGFKSLALRFAAAGATIIAMTTGHVGESVDDADAVRIEGAADIGGPTDWLARVGAHAEASNGVQTGRGTFVYVQRR
jgi:hypothetical protein